MASRSIADLGDTDFKLRDLKVQLGQCSLVVDSKDVPVWRVIDFGSQKCLS